MNKKETVLNKLGEIISEMVESENLCKSDALGFLKRAEVILLDGKEDISDHYMYPVKINTSTICPIIVEDLQTGEVISEHPGYYFLEVFLRDKIRLVGKQVKINCKNFKSVYKIISVEPYYNFRNNYNFNFRGTALKPFPDMCYIENIATGEKTWTSEDKLIIDYKTTLEHLFAAKKELEDSKIKEEQHALGYINEAIKWIQIINENN